MLDTLIEGFTELLQFGLCVAVGVAIIAGLFTYPIATLLVIIIFLLL
jgi:hypothetical protein